MTATDTGQKLHSIAQLCDRFDITSRTLNRWVNNLSKQKGIEIEFVKTGLSVGYPAESVEILEEYNNHLKADSRNNCHNFELATRVKVETVSDRVVDGEDRELSDNSVHVDLSSLSANIDLQVVQEIATQFAIAFTHAYEQQRQQSALSPVDKREELLKCAENGFALTSAEIKHYTGKYPRRTKGRNYYAFGNFRFYMKGLQGKQSVWEVAISN